MAALEEQAADGGGRQSQDATKAEDQGQQTSFQRFINASQRGLFGLGFVLAKDFEPVTLILIVGYFFDLGQLLSFPLSDDERLPWQRAPGVGSLSSSLSFLTRAISADENPAAFLSLLVVAFLWVVSYLCLAYSVAARFSEDEPQSELALRALRMMTSLSSGPLYIPTSTVILQGIACQDNNWLNTGLQCSGPGHGVIAFILSINLLGFSSLAVFASLIWVDRSPASLNWGARQHGRYDAAMIVIKLLLGFCYAVLNHQLVGTVFMSIVLMALGLAQAYAHAFVPVFVQRDVNAMYSGGGLALFYAALCLLIAQLLGPEQAYLSVFLGLPTVFGLGFFAARRRLDLIGRGHLRQCQSLADVHVWARRRMQRFAALKHLSERSGVQEGGEASIGAPGEAQQGGNGWTADESDDEGDIDEQLDSEGTGAGGDDGTTGLNDDASSVQSGGSRPSHMGNRSMSTARRRRRKADQESQARSSAFLLARGVSLQVADQLSPEDVKLELKRVKAEAERGYQYGMERFNRDEMAFIQFGIFTRYFARFSFLECIALSRALKLNPSMDSRFYIFTRIRALRESDGSGLSPVDRVLFDGAFKEVMQMRLQAYRYMSRLWNTLGSSQPDMADLLATGIAMKGTLEKIDEAFRRLMSLNSESTQVLRALAAYLIDLRSQPARAAELLNKASRVEDTSRKQRMKLVQSVEFGASTQAQSILEDGAAIITISGAATLGSTSKLGEIVHVTQSASRLFGYGASQLLGQNVAVLVPSPIDIVHNRLIAGFGRKRSSMVVGNTRLVFGRRRAGEIFPMWLQVSEAPPDERTAEPRFSAVVHEVVTQQDFVIFGGPEVQFKVHGASSRALEMLGLEAEALAADDVSMTQYFPSIDSTYNERIPLNEADIRAIAAVPVVQDLEEVLGSIRVPGATFRGTAVSIGDSSGFKRPNLAASSGKSPSAEAAAGFGSLVPAGSADSGEGQSALPPIIGASRVRDGRVLGHSVGFSTPQTRKSAGNDDLQREGGTGRHASTVRGSKGRSRRHAEARTSRHDQLQAAIQSCESAQARPLRQTRKPGIVPVRVLGVDRIVVGSCQRVSIPGVSSFYVLRFNVLQYATEGDIGVDDDAASVSRRSKSSVHQLDASQRAHRRFGRAVESRRGLLGHEGKRETNTETNRYNSGAWNARTVSKSSMGSFTAGGGIVLEAMPSERSLPQGGPRTVVQPHRADSKSSDIPSDSLRAVRITGDATDRDVAVGSVPEPKVEDKNGEEEEGGPDEEDDLLGDLDSDDGKEGRADMAETGSKRSSVKSEERKDGETEVLQSMDDLQLPEGGLPPGKRGAIGPSGQTQAQQHSSIGAATAYNPGSATGPFPSASPNLPPEGPTKDSLASELQAPPSLQPQKRGGLRRAGSQGRGILKTASRGNVFAAGRSPSPPHPDALREMDDDAVSMSVKSVSIKDGQGGDPDGTKERSFHSGTGSTRSTIARIHQLSRGAVEPEIRSIRIMLLVLALAVLALGVGIVLYIRNVVGTIRNNSASVWIAGQRRRAMQSGIDAVLWMSFQSFDANGTVTGASDVLDSVEDTVRRLQLARAASDLKFAGELEADMSMLHEAFLPAVSPEGILPSPVAQTAEGEKHWGMRRQLQYSTNAKSATMAEHGKGALELLRLISDEVQIAQAKLFELQTPHQVALFEGTVRTQLRLPQEAGGGTIFVPLVQHVQEIVAAMRRISRLDPRNVSVSHRDVLFLSLNSEVWDMAMGHSLEIRYEEYSAVFPRTVREVVIFGACAFLLYNVLGSIIFARLTTRLGSKVQMVLQTFLLLPRSTARRLANRSQRQLNKVLREINSELGSDSEDESDDDDDEVDGAGSTGPGSESGIDAFAPRAPNPRDSQSDRNLLAQSLGQGKASDGNASASSREGNGTKAGSGGAIMSAVVAAHHAAKSTRSFGSRRSRTSRWSSRKAREVALLKAMGNLRDHKDSSQFVLRSTVWLLLPILLVLGFITFFVLWQLAFTQVLLRTSQRIIASSSLETQLAGTTNTMLTLNSAIARNVGSDRILELARRADLQGQKTTAVSAVLTFGGQAVLTKLLVANATQADETFGVVSTREVTLDAIQSTVDPGGRQAYDIMHGDSCAATIWPNITTDVTLGRVDASESRPAESDVTSQEYIDTLAMCLEREGGVLGEGALSAVATVVFNLRQAVSAVFLDLEGLPPPSMRSNSADDVSVIRRDRRTQGAAAEGDDWGADGYALATAVDSGSSHLRGAPDTSVPGSALQRLTSEDEAEWVSGWAHQAGEGGEWDWDGGDSTQGTIRQDAPKATRSIAKESGNNPDAMLASESGEPELRVRQTQASTTEAESANSTQPRLQLGTVSTMLDFTFRIRSIVNPFLLHSISAVRINFFLGLNSNLISGQSLVEVAAWVFVGVFLLTSALYWPAVASLNLPLTSARQMLLLLPEETILRVTVLRTALYRIATEHERSLAGSATVSPEGGGEGGGGGEVVAATV